MRFCNSPFFKNSEERGFGIEPVEELLHKCGPLRREPPQIDLRGATNPEP